MQHSRKDQQRLGTMLREHSVQMLRLRLAMLNGDVVDSVLGWRVGVLVVRLRKSAWQQQIFHTFHRCRLLSIKLDPQRGKQIPS
jgi:hypothetical protein